jgi:hypothetical protein
VDDAALIGVDHGDEVGRLDVRASVQAGEVEKLSGGAWSASCGELWKEAGFLCSECI